MIWRCVRAALLVGLPPGVLAVLLEVRLVTGMGPWDVRLGFLAALMMGIWSLSAYQSHWPKPDETEEEKPPVVDDGLSDSLRAILNSAGRAPIPVIQVGTDGPCADCGEVHGNVMVLVPLPDASFLVSHKDRSSGADECDWAQHVTDMSQARVAAELHEFQCVRHRQAA